jgi:DNA-binding XRE family transcriptional regulator
LPLRYQDISVGLSVSGSTRTRIEIPLYSANQSFVALPCLHTSLHFRFFRQFCECRNLSRSFFQVTPQTISNWLYRRKRPSLDKYLAVTEFSTQNAVMEMPPRVRKMLNELEAYAKRNRVKQKDLAKDLGVEPQRLSDWLRGHRTPNAERILKIQEFLRTKKS